MKRITIVAMALCLALALAVPAMALDADFSGEFRVRGLSHDHPDLADNAANNFYDMRTRIKSVFTITDNISFTTRFDALDRRWGTNNDDDTSNNYQDAEDIDFDYAYATIKTPVGGLLVGRVIGSQWGPSGMGDSNDSGVDRILLFVPIENWTFVAYTQKFSEYDSNGDADDATQSWGDMNKHTALAKYKGENYEAGFLLTHYDFEAMPTMNQAFTALGTKAAVDAQIAAAATTLETAKTNTATAAATYAATLAPADLATYQAAALNQTTQQAAYDLTVSQGNAAVAAAEAATSEARIYVLDPYVKYSLGGFSFFGELLYAFGDADVPGNGTDLDISALDYHVEGKYDFGPAAIRAGYFYQEGDNDITDDEHNAVGYLEANKELEIAFILTGGDNDFAGLSNTLGELGNFSGRVNDGAVTPVMGAKLIYAGITFSPMENLDLDFLYANAKVDAPFCIQGGTSATNYDDEVGNEYDFTLTWTPMDNLEYKAVAAFLDAGDYWKQGVANAKIEDNLTLFHSLTINF